MCSNIQTKAFPANLIKFWDGRAGKFWKFVELTRNDPWVNYDTTKLKLIFLKTILTSENNMSAERAQRCAVISWFSDTTSCTQFGRSRAWPVTDFLINVTTTCCGHCDNITSCVWQCCRHRWIHVARGLIKSSLLTGRNCITACFFIGVLHLTKMSLQHTTAPKCMINIKFAQHYYNTLKWYAQVFRKNIDFTWW